MRAIDGDAVLDRYYAEFEKQDICDGSQDKDWLMRCIKEAPTLTTPSEWISMEDRTPEFTGFLDHIMVITCDKNGHVMPMVRERILVGYGWMERWLYPWNKIYDGPEITHWMPLPKPPKKGKEELKDDSTTD